MPVASPSESRLGDRRRSMLSASGAIDGENALPSHIVDRYLRPASLAKAFDTAAWGGSACSWIADERHGFLPVSIVDMTEGACDRPGEAPAARRMVTVELPDRSRRTVPAEDVFPGNTARYERCEDVAEMAELSEATVLHVLRQRFSSDLIYTYSGLFLVAVNPYRPLPVYGPAAVEYYRGARRGERPPHVYAVADAAYRALIATRQSQSILITGESGAGKTENTKRVIQYLAAVAGRAWRPSDEYEESVFRGGRSCSGSASGEVRRSVSEVGAPSVRHTRTLEDQIILANPVLEAFGNAQTVRNNNSSRFGKFVRIEFSNTTHEVAGASVERYLLEKSRVTHRAAAERSFHVFYQLAAGAPADLLARLGLPADRAACARYGYLAGSNVSVDGVDDATDYAITLDAMAALGMDAAERETYMAGVAAVLHLGALRFDPTPDGSQAVLAPSSRSALDALCTLCLCVDADAFLAGLLAPIVRAGRGEEAVVVARDAAQVRKSVDGLARALYDRLFGRLLARVNRTLAGRSASAAPSGAHEPTRFIGVLDIAGFEIFERNSFEQLCINHTNERLQQFFNHHMFVVEQEAYRREAIEWDYIDFGLDLQPTINLIERTSPLGILAALDEECVVPRATDASFVAKLVSAWAPGQTSGSPRKPAALSRVQSGTAIASSVSQAAFEPLRFGEGFAVKHYAGRVEYSAEGWLEKNKDPLNDSVVRLLAASSQAHVAELWADCVPSADDDGSSRQSGRKGLFRTVAQKHRESLQALMHALHATQPHFVRCIVPNAVKRAGDLDAPMVLGQLACNGVLEGIRICRLGYPNRVPYADFRRLYELLYVSAGGRSSSGILDAVASIGDRIIGRKSSLLAPLETDARTATQQLLAHLGIRPHAEFVLGQTMVFFRAGVLARLDELRDARLAAVLRAFQAAFRVRLARLRRTLLARQADAAAVVAHGARLLLDVRASPWFRLVAQVRPLLSVTRTEHRIAVLEKAAASAEAAAADANTLNDTLRAEILSAEERVRVLEERLAETQDDAATLRRRLSDADAERSRTERLLADARSEATKAARELADAMGRLSALEASLQSANDRMQVSEAALAESRELLATAKQQSEERLETMRVDSQRMLSESRVREDGHAAECERLRLKITDYETRCSSSALRIAALEDEIAVIGGERKVSEERMADALRAAEQRVQSATAEAMAQSETLAAAHARAMAERNLEIERGARALAEAKSQSESERAAMTASHTAEVQRLERALSEALQTGKTLDTELTDVRERLRLAEERIDSSARVFEETQTTLANTRSDLDTALSESREKDAQLLRATEHAADVDASLRRAEDALATERALLARTEQRLRDAVDEHAAREEALVAERTALAAQLTDARSRSLESDAELGRTLALVRSAESRVSDLDAELVSVRSAHETQKSSLELCLRAARGELDEARSRMSAAEALAESLRAELSSVRAPSARPDYYNEIVAAIEASAKEAALRDAELVVLRKTLLERDRCIADKDSLLAERERLITERERALSDAHAHIADRDRRASKSAADGDLVRNAVDSVLSAAALGQ